MEGLLLFILLATGMLLVMLTLLLLLHRHRPLRFLQLPLHLLPEKKLPPLCRVRFSP